MKYLKTWMGVVTGSMAGRDDGYPEQKFHYYNTLEDLAKGYGKHKDEEYYELVPLEKNRLQENVLVALAASKERAKEEKKASIEEQIMKLQKELKELS